MSASHLRRDIFTVLMILAGVGAYFLYDRMTPKPEQELRAIVDRMTKAAAAADSHALLADLTESYLHEEVEREDLKQMLDEYFKAYGPTTVTVRGWEPNVTGQIAVANVRILSEAANKEAWGGRGAESLWRLSFVERNDKWLVDRIVPVHIMGQEVSGFDFKQEIKEAAEAALDKAQQEMDARKAREKTAQLARQKIMLEKRREMLKRFPAKAEQWLIDDFEKGSLEWSAKDWGHACSLSAVVRNGSRQLQATVTRTQQDKAAIERAIERDFSSRGTVSVDVENASDGDVQLALALNVQERRGHYEWYESPPAMVSQGLNKGITFDLTADDYKCLRTQWKHTAAPRNLDGVVRIFFLIYTVRPGAFYFDNIISTRRADWVPPAPQEEGDEGAPEPQPKKARRAKRTRPRHKEPANPPASP